MSSFKDKVARSSLGAPSVRAARHAVTHTEASNVIQRSNALRSSTTRKSSFERGGN